MIDDKKPVHEARINEFHKEGGIVCVQANYLSGNFGFYNCYAREMVGAYQPVAYWRIKELKKKVA